MSRNALPPTRRASEVALEALIDPGTPGSGGTWSTRDTSVTAGTPDDGGTSNTSGTEGASGTRGTSSASMPTEPREHVKVRRALADEMRDAVWFLSEHGRPRVRLGELLDEAVSAWLDEVKREHNEGEGFPRRGRLR